jgi:AraC-like DNA-binding protein
MKPALLKITNNNNSTFHVRRETSPSNHDKWHYHQEIEIVYFKKGSGTQFAGDHISRFMPGDITIVGAGLPHYWRFDNSYITGERPQQADIIVVHFSEDCFGPRFLELVENKTINQMLQRARRGLAIKNEDRKLVAILMERLVKSEGIEKIIWLLKILQAIANSKQTNPLSSMGFKYKFNEQECERINAIYQYTFAHFRNKIFLEEISEVAHICPNSFCRYFKSMTHKTYSRFILEIKIGNACNLLIESEFKIGQIGLECGFNRSSTFYKYFKKITGKSPATYKKLYTGQLKEMPPEYMPQIHNGPAALYS